jgi:hypothetical protein
MRMGRGCLVRNGSVVTDAVVRRRFFVKAVFTSLPPPPMPPSCNNPPLAMGRHAIEVATMNLSRWVGMAVLACGGLLLGTPARAGDISCKMNFQLAGWSVFYKTASGSGTVRCSNGQSLHVKLRAKGGGLTFGKTKITDGIGKFTGVGSVRDVLGHYANAEAHAGASKSAEAQVLTKGNVSLALSGKGEGWNLGVAFGAFIIE